jgi:hypothetical protein
VTIQECDAEWFQDTEGVEPLFDRAVTIRFPAPGAACLFRAAFEAATGKRTTRFELATLSLGS